MQRSALTLPGQQAVDQSPNLDELLKNILDLTLKVLKADAGLIRICEEDTRELVMKAHQGFSEEEISLAVTRRTFGEGVAWKCLQMGKPMITMHADTDAASFIKKAGFHSSANIPLTSKNRAIGTMSIFQRALREFSAHEEELFAGIGNQVGVAIDNAYLLKQVGRQTQSLTILYAIAQTVSQSLNLAQILNNALDAIMDLLPRHSVNIRQLEEKRSELVLIAQKGLNPEDLVKFPKRRRLGEGMSSLSLTSGKVLVIEDLLTHPLAAGQQPASLEIGCRSFVAIPLYAKDKLLGSVSIRYRDQRLFDEDEIRLYTSIGHLIGTAMENARLYQDKEAARQELDKAQAQLQHAQKMQAIGTLTGGIAHDFNNILATIMGYAEMALLKMAAPDPLRLNITNILEAVQRAAQLTNDLLVFSRKQTPEKKLADLNAIIGKAGEVLIRVIGEDIDFQTVLHAKTLPIFANRNQIEQVLVNFATNARDAMPRGGKFTLSAEETEIDDAFINFHGYGRPGRYAMITAADTGMGMDRETRQRAFDPFFTTKEVGKGTGLGLSVVYGIIKQHDGYITVYSEPGMGATFKAYLPLDRSAASSGEEATANVAYPSYKGAETILLAEDDRPLREMTTTVLKESGYKVIPAVDGEDAVAKFIKNKDSIHLLLFDLIMPKKTGKEAYDAIRMIKPGIKVIFVSGYAADKIRGEILIEKGTLVLSKPILPKELLKKVREALETDA